MYGECDIFLYNKKLHELRYEYMFYLHDLHDVDTYLSHEGFYGCISILFSQSGVVVVGYGTSRVEFEGVIFPEFIQAAFEGV